MANPYEIPVDSLLRCPICGERKKITTRALQWEIHRKCESCGNEWSGGCAVAAPDVSEPLPIPGVPDLTDDIPRQIVDPPFRNPRKNYGGGDD